MSANDAASQPVMNPEEFQSDLTGHVFGIVDDPKTNLPAITAALLAADVPVDGIHLYCCQPGADAFDPSGSHHGLKARITRTMQSLVYEDQMQVIEDALESGHGLVGVDADGSADRIAAILRGHSGHDIVHYGRYTWERMSGTQPANTSTVPESKAVS